jgi:hypothetical protein
VELLGNTWNSTIKFLPSLLLSVLCQFVLCVLKWYNPELHMVLVIGHHPQTWVRLPNQFMWDKLWEKGTGTAVPLNNSVFSYPTFHQCFMSSSSVTNTI